MCTVFGVWGQSAVATRTQSEMCEINIDSRASKFDSKTGERVPDPVSPRARPAAAIPSRPRRKPSMNEAESGPVFSFYRDRSRRGIKSCNPKNQIWD